MGVDSGRGCRSIPLLASVWAAPDTAAARNRGPPVRGAFAFPLPLVRSGRSPRLETSWFEPLLIDGARLRPEPPPAQRRQRVDVPADERLPLGPTPALHLLLEPERL